MTTTELIIIAVLFVLLYVLGAYIDCIVVASPEE